MHASLVMCSSCMLFAPLEETRSTADAEVASCSEEDCASQEQQQHAEDAAIFTSVDYGSAAAVCAPPGEAACDPITSCNCKPDESCEFDYDFLDAGVILGDVTCVPRRDGGVPLGGRCKWTQDCVSGLICGIGNLCAQYCVTDPDCGSQAECLSYTLPGTRRIISAAGGCLSSCDPVTAGPCPSHATCQPASDARVPATALCGSGALGDEIRDRGAHCKVDWDCAHGLGCALLGPSVCTPFCRSDADCPTDARRCDFQANLRAGPGDPVGQCLADCNGITVPPPVAWSFGTVVSQQDFKDGTMDCGPNASCYTKRLKDKPQFEVCLKTALYALGGALDASCRATYVDSICGWSAQRDAAESLFEQCLARHPSYLETALTVCVEASP